MLIISFSSLCKIKYGNPKHCNLGIDKRVSSALLKKNMLYYNKKNIIVYAYNIGTHYTDIIIICTAIAR